MSPADELRELGAHHDLVQWADEHAPDWPTLYSTCPRGDWLLAIGAKRGADTQKLVAAAVECAGLALASLANDERRPGDALETVKQWLAGEAEVTGCEAAADGVATLFDAMPDPGAQLAVAAVEAALRAPADPGAAASAAASAVQAAVLDANECAMMSILRFTHDECANIARKHLSLADLTP